MPDAPADATAAVTATDALPPEPPSTDAQHAAFYDYVRGRSDVPPPGHNPAGLRVYRHLVYLGAEQMVESAWPDLRAQLGEAQWRTLLQAFVRQSRWTSHYYADLIDEFQAFLLRESA